MVLFNNPIDRQQMTTLARSAEFTIFMKRFEEATSRPCGNPVVYLKLSTPEQDGLRTNFSRSKSPSGEENVSDADDTSSVGSIDDIHELGPPCKRRKLRDERSRPDIWNRRFQDPLRHANIEQFKT